MLVSEKPIDDNLDSLIRMTEYDRDRMHQFSYSLIGLDVHSLRRLVLLESKRWELFLMNPVNRGGCDHTSEEFRVINESRIFSARHVNIHASIYPLSFIGFVDYSYVNVTAWLLLELRARQSTDKEIEASFNLLLNVLWSTTIRSILLFLDTQQFHPVAHGSLLRSLIASMELRHHFHHIYFNKNEVLDGEVKVIRDEFLYQSTSVWILQKNLVASAPVVPFPSEISPSSSSSPSPSSSPFSSSSPSSVMQPHHSSLLFENYGAGKSHILLTNVCLSSAVIRTDVDMSSRDNLTLLVDSNRSDGLLNFTFLAEEEDYGFLYTGLEVLDINGPAFSPEMRELARSNMRTWPRFSDMTALTFSVQSGHIVHETEPFMQFLYAAHIELDDLVKTCPAAVLVRNHSTGLTEKAMKEFDVGVIDEHYHFILCRLRRVVAAKMTAGSVKDWILKMVGLVFSYLDDKVSRSCSATTSRKCTTENLSVPLSFLLRDHLVPDEPSGGGSGGGVCFDQLLLLGRVTTHTAYFGSRAIAQSFKQFVYEKLSIQCTINSTWPVSSLVHTDEKKAFRSGLRLLRVTIALRPGPSRRILNLPEVLSLLLSLKGRPFDGRMSGRSLIDESWLRDHILIFDDLTFSQQVALMYETDVFISVHGAALINGIFMREGSVAIDILNGRFIEFVFSAPLRFAPCPLVAILHPMAYYTLSIKRESGVEMLYLSSDDPDVYKNCPVNTPSHCFERLHAYDAADIECWLIRQCSVTVDLPQLYRLAMQAYKYVKSAKFS